MSKHEPRLDRARSASFAAIAIALSAGCSGSGSTPTDPVVPDPPNGEQQAVAVAIAPQVATVGLAAQQPFVASVTGTADTSVTWHIPDPGCGTVTNTGLYTAPGAAASCQVVVTSNADPTKSAVSQVTVADTRWEQLKVGAGGWVTGIDFDKAGTTFAVRADVHGGYVGNPAQGEPWRNVTRADTMPASYMAGPVYDWGWIGPYEVRVAPSNGNILYMLFNSHVFRSTDRGQSWVQTAFSYTGWMDPNDGTYRTYGEHMAIDPANPSVVYAGTVGSGVLVTTDAGTTWTQIAAIAIPTTNGGITGIVFDESSGTTNGMTNAIYLASAGTGVYRSTDAGATWALLGGPTNVHHAAIATDGAYYATDGSSTVYRYMSGAWTTSSPGVNAHTITTDPFNAARVVAGYDGGTLSISTDRGATWTGQIGNTSSQTRTASDIPWLAFAFENWMSSGSLKFDPTVPNKLWFTEGIGVWYTTLPSNSPTRTDWISASLGIEQLVGRDVIVPPGNSNVIVGGMDRSIFVVPIANSSYPSRYGTEPRPSRPLMAAWSLAYSPTNPQHLVALINQGSDLSSYSLDGGATWTKFPVGPAGTSGSGGCIVVTGNLAGTHAIIAIVGGQGAYRSTDRGASWTPLSIPSNISYLFGGYLNMKHILAVDGVDPNTIYLHFYGYGIYRSTDAGATWTLVSSQSFDGANARWHTRIRSVPGQSGHLFLTAGHAGGSGSANPGLTHLWRSTDGGTTWTSVTGVAEPYDVAVGRAAPGQAYPAIYFVGWYNNVYGIWRSIDSAATWSKIGTFPFNSFDEITRIAASQDVFGDVYVAFQGSGWGKGTMSP